MENKIKTTISDVKNFKNKRIKFDFNSHLINRPPFYEATRFL